jgi:hypothetical protein
MKKESPPREKAEEIYKIAYSRWCYELSHEKNVGIAKNISEFVCDKILENCSDDKLKEYWETVKFEIKKVRH